MVSDIGQEHDGIITHNARWRWTDMGHCAACGQTLEWEEILYFPSSRRAYCRPCGDSMAPDFPIAEHLYFPGQEGGD